MSTGCLGVGAGVQGHLPLVVTHGYRDGRLDRPATPATRLGPVGDRRAVGLVRAWLPAGGPGRQPVPSELRSLVLQPPHRPGPATN